MEARLAKQANPVVLVTGPDKRFKFGWWVSQLLLKKYGLEPKYVTASTGNKYKNVDGVVIGGGDDIEPSHYGLVGDDTGSYDKARDRMELDVASKALAADVPILGICRGAQLLNIALGGNLHADIRTLRRKTPKRNSILPAKLAYLLKMDAAKYLISASHFLQEKAEPVSDEIECKHQKMHIRINQLHHQAIDKLGLGLKVIAKDDDGFIQAVAEKGAAGGSILGVQWHPEYMPYSKVQRGIFKKFSENVYSYSR